MWYTLQSNECVHQHPEQYHPACPPAACDSHLHQNQLGPICLRHRHFRTDRYETIKFGGF